MPGTIRFSFAMKKIDNKENLIYIRWRRDKTRKIRDSGDDRPGLLHINESGRKLGEYARGSGSNSLCWKWAEVII